MTSQHFAVASIYLVTDLIDFGRLWAVDIFLAAAPAGPLVCFDIALSRMRLIRVLSGFRQMPILLRSDAIHVVGALSDEKFAFGAKHRVADCFDLHE